MSKKIVILIVSSILGLLSLSFIQGYLIKNTYSLEKKFLKSRAEKEIGRITRHNSALDSINDIFGEVFIKELDKYAMEKISKKELLNRLKVIKDSLNPIFIKVCEDEIKLKKLPYNLKYQKRLKNIVVNNRGVIDSIFSESKNKNYKLLGHEFQYDPDLILGSSAWETERSFQNKEKNTLKEIAYTILFQTKNYINIDDSNRVIFNKMKGLLLLSFLIFVSIIGVSFYSIKSLITQKKIADVKTDFINNITHEFKTPLATLSLATKILYKNEEVKSSEVVMNTVNTIERQNARLQKLIDQVLNNSLGYKEIVLKKETVSINNYLNTILDDFQIALKNKEIQLERNLPNTSFSCLLDVFYMTTAILNVLENAVKYGNSIVKVTMKVEEENVLISITDNGIGVSKKHLKFLFDKFYRAENKQIHNVKGLGLGLYYSNQILKAHQGKITVKSEKEKGTTFKIQIPYN